MTTSSYSTGGARSETKRRFILSRTGTRDNTHTIKLELKCLHIVASHCITRINAQVLHQSHKQEYYLVKANCFAEFHCFYSTSYIKKTPLPNFQANIQGLDGNPAPSSPALCTLIAWSVSAVVISLCPSKYDQSESRLNAQRHRNPATTLTSVR